MAHLRLIASKNSKEYFANKVKDIASHSNIDLKECDIDTYWKDSDLILIEAAYSVSAALTFDTWKELFSEIAKDYTVRKDRQSTDFEHFEMADTLKTETCSCFAVFSIPCNSIKLVGER